MTTANFLNVSPVNTGKGVQVKGTKKLQEENPEAASVFSALMHNQVELTNQIVSEGSGPAAVSKTEGVSDAAESYERYNYKENKIDAAEEKPIEETIEEAADELEQFEEEAVEAICEEYGVDKETVLKVLDKMGLGVLDLLNPQNLVNFIMELTGITSVEELLLDESFLNIMETFDSMKTDLMNELNITPNELNELISQMEIVNPDGGETAVFQEELETQINQLNNSDNVTEAENKTVTETVAESTQEIPKELEEGAEGKKEVKVEVKNANETSVSEENVSSENKNESETFARNDNSTPFSGTDSNESMVMSNNSAVNNTTSDVPQMQAGAYTSVDTMQIINQIAEQVRVYANADTTTMEMQLNPENLGKVILHISSEEGVVNAQFTATTEIAKEALEAQIATLRENLTQAGVKVDAIEVTIASHEFEQNLEQHQNHSEETVKQEESNGRRRNLHIDSLDELSGVMTEEETLAAQIMKENGNSVDLTA